MISSRIESATQIVNAIELRRKRTKKYFWKKKTMRLIHTKQRSASVTEAKRDALTFSVLSNRAIIQGTSSSRTSMSVILQLTTFLSISFLPICIILYHLDAPNSNYYATLDGMRSSTGASCILPESSRLVVYRPLSLLPSWTPVHPMKSSPLRGCRTMT